MNEGVNFKTTFFSLPTLRKYKLESRVFVSGEPSQPSQTFVCKNNRIPCVRQLKGAKPWHRGYTLD